MKGRNYKKIIGSKGVYVRLAKSRRARKGFREVPEEKSTVHDAPVHSETMTLEIHRKSSHEVHEPVHRESSPKKFNGGTNEV